MKSKRTVCRKCVSCGSITEKGSLLRIARNRDGALSLDPTGSMEGRGAYICRNKECAEKAFRKNALERSFRAGIGKEVKERLFKEIEEVGF